MHGMQKNQVIKIVQDHIAENCIYMCIELDKLQGESRSRIT